MSLCDQCRRALIYERATGTRTYLCSAPGAWEREMPHDIVACSCFENRAQPELYDLQDMSWQLEKDGHGRVRGFRPPKKD